MLPSPSDPTATAEAQAGQVQTQQQQQQEQQQVAEHLTQAALAAGGIMPGLPGGAMLPFPGMGPPAGVVGAPGLPHGGIPVPPMPPMDPSFLQFMAMAQMSMAGGPHMPQHMQPQQMPQISPKPA